MSLNALEQYVKSYNRAVFKLTACGRAAPSEKRLRSFEEAIDFEFCDVFRRFTLSPMGGMCLEVTDDLWPRPTELAPGEEWKNLYNVRVFGIAAGVPKELDLNLELNSLPPEETDLIPFMARGGEAERYCFDLDHNIVRWSPKDGERSSISQDFCSLLMSEISELEKRRERYLKDTSGKKKSRSRKKV